MFRTGRARVVAVLIVAAALFAIAEIGARMLTDLDSRWNVRLGAHRRYDPVTQFRNKPDYELPDGTRTNERGFLAPRDLPRSTDPGMLRLIYLGDSVSFYPPAENYPAQVERILEERLRIDAETLNAAVPGFASHNARALFESEVSEYDADVLIVYLGWNDLGQFGPEGLPYKRIETGYRVSAFQRLLSKSYSVRLLYQLKRIVRRRLPVVDEPLSEAELAMYRAYDPDHYRENLQAIVRLGKSRYTRVFLVTPATITSDSPTPAEMSRAHFPVGMSKNIRKLHLLVGAYDRVVREVAEVEGVPLIDLNRRFDSREAREYLADSCHVHRDGAGIIAETVVETLLADGLFRDSP